MTINQNIVNLSSMTPLTINEAAEIISMIKIPEGQSFIITDKELHHEPKKTFFNRAKDAIIKGEIK